MIKDAMGPWLPGSGSLLRRPGVRSTGAAFLFKHLGQIHIAPLQGADLRDVTLRIEGGYPEAVPIQHADLDGSELGVYDPILQDSRPLIELELYQAVVPFAGR